MKSRPDSPAAGGIAGTSTWIPSAESPPRHLRTSNEATHFTLGGDSGSTSHRFTHLGQRGFFNSGAGFEQQQFAESDPHGVTQPQARTVCRVWITGKPNAPTACENTRTIATSDRKARLEIRERRGMDRGGNLWQEG